MSAGNEDRNDPENGDEMQSLASKDSQQPSPDPTDLIGAFKAEIKSSIKNNASQLLMIITSGMYVVSTNPEDGAAYFIPLVFSILVFINVIILLVLIVVRKKAFKTKDGQCPTKTMEKARTLQKIYRGFSISLIVLQVLFTIVTGVSVSGAMDEDHKNETSTVTIATSTIGEYVVNNTSG